MNFNEPSSATPDSGHSPQFNSDLKLSWSEHIAEWERSHLSQKKFCESQDLSYCRFLYWRRKLRPDCEQRQKPESDVTGFVPLVLEHRPADPLLSIVLTDGIEIKNVRAENLAIVRELIRVL